MTAHFFRVLVVGFVGGALFFPSPTVSAGQNDRAFLWVAKSAAGTAYILGSIHIAKPDAYPLPDKIEKAFEASTLLAVEVNMNDINASDLAQGLMAKAVYPDGDNLRNHISKGLWEKLAAKLARNGIPEEAFERFKPWFAAVTLSGLQQKADGFSADLGIDQHFMRKAKGNKGVMQMESMEDQLSLLNGFSPVEQESFLAGVLADGPGGAASDSTDAVYKVWLAGDDKKLEALLNPWKNDPSMASGYEKMFRTRNEKMADQIDQLLQTGQNVFVVVGAGHLVGSDGVINLLSKKYPVKRL